MRAADAGLRRPAPSASITQPGRMPASRQSAASANIAASEKRSTSCAARPRVDARPAEERDAEGLDEAAAASAADSASSAPTAGIRNFSPHCGSSRAEQDRLEGQPFGDEAVERRQGGDRDAADQEGEARSAACGGSARRAAPCRARRSRVSTAPAPKNSRLLNSEWLKTWNSAAVSASAAAAAACRWPETRAPGRGR